MDGFEEIVWKRPRGFHGYISDIDIKSEIGTFIRFAPCYTTYDHRRVDIRFFTDDKEMCAKVFDAWKAGKYVSVTAIAITAAEKLFYLSSIAEE